VDCDIHDPPQWEGGAKAESENRQMGGQAMRKYRIAELYNQYSIEVDDGGDKWVDAYMLMPRVPKFFDSLADARSWVATIKRGVVYHDAEAPPLSESNLQWECARDFRIFRNHDAEDAPNLAQDERKAEGDVKVCDEWEEHITRHISWLLMERGMVNGVEIRRVSIDDNVIRIYT
jgi:hypothetical protein